MLSDVVECGNKPCDAHDLLIYVQRLFSVTAAACQGASLLLFIGPRGDLVVHQPCEDHPPVVRTKSPLIRCLTACSQWGGEGLLTHRPFPAPLD